jgi:hypothetical protein
MPLLHILLLVVLVILFLGLLPTWPYAAAWGPYPAGGVGIVIVIIIILLLIG